VATVAFNEVHLQLLENFRLAKLPLPPETLIDSKNRKVLSDNPEPLSFINIVMILPPAEKVGVVV